MAMAAAKRKVRRMLVPAANAREAAVVEELAVNSVSTLAEAVGIVSGSLIVEPTDSNTDEFFDRLHSDDVDFSDVRARVRQASARDRREWRTQRAHVLDNSPPVREIFNVGETTCNEI
jgi:predicted ATPase with chaperone activity